MVVCPIKALIDDQIMKLKQIGILASSLGDIELKKADSNKGLSIIFASPEAILENNSTGNGRDTIISMSDRICGIFVDECHIVPKW